MKARSSLLIVSALLLTACGQTTTRVALSPGPNECQITESRTALSTITVSVCWDAKTQALGMAGGSGMPATAVPLSILQSGATVTGAGIMGGAIKSGLKSIESVTPAP